MRPTFEQIFDILKTLPISYYLKAKIPVILEDKIKQSNFDVERQEIHISYPQLQKIDVEESELEEVVRSNLYHELSHVLLSPQEGELKINPEIFNIFEDERIEVILRDFYMNVNFKKSIQLIAPYRTPKNNTDKFFFAVRHRRTSDIINRLINHIIKKYRHLNSENLIAYQEDILALYTLICDEDDQKNQSVENTNVAKPEGKNKNDNEEVSHSKASGEVDGGEGDIDPYDISEFKLIKKPSELYSTLKSIIMSKNFSNGNNEVSKASYSGKLHPKRACKPDTNYKWFSKQGDGFLRNGKKIILNLFIDSSGSFTENEDDINQMLFDLEQIEKEIPKFSFNLVAINQGCWPMPKNNRRIYCIGSNFLDSQVREVFNKLQNPNNSIYNIVLFYGSAICVSVHDINTGEWLPEYSDKQAQWFRVFSSPNTVIISDKTNEPYIREYAYRAKIIISKFYTRDLKDNIIKSFKILFS